MAYLYRHIRLDKNEPFYIGIGKSDNGLFKRSKQRTKRSQFWKNIASKTKYKIEIVMEDDSESFIKYKEKEFISLYGRLDLGTGTLVNLTDGGDGGVKWKPTKEQLLKMSESRMSDKNGFFNKTHTEETKSKMRLNHYDCKGKNNSFYGKKHRQEVIDKLRAINTGKVKSLEQKKKVSKAVIDTISGTEYYSIIEASRVLKIPFGTIYAKLNGRLNNNLNLIFKE